MGVALDGQQVTKGVTLNACSALKLSQLRTAPLARETSEKYQGILLFIECGSHVVNRKGDRYISYTVCLYLHIYILYMKCTSNDIASFPLTFPIVIALKI